MSSTPHGAGLRISAHAVTRWIERVDAAASPLEARLALAQLLSLGKTRPTPRHWTDVRPKPGLAFVYWAQRPSVCALVIDGVVVTVLTRALCAATASLKSASLRTVDTSTERRRPSARDISAWRWNGHGDVA